MSDQYLENDEPDSAPEEALNDCIDALINNQPLTPDMKVLVKNPNNHALINTILFGIQDVEDIKVDEMIDIWGRLQSIAPESAIFQIGNACTLSNNGDDELALPYALRALELEFTSGAIHLIIGQIYHSLDHKDIAHDHFEYAATFSPGDASAHGLLAGSFSDQGQKEHALQHYMAACTLAPEKAYYFIDAANVHIALGNSTDAMECLLKAKALLPFNDDNSGTGDDHLALAKAFDILDETHEAELHGLEAYRIGSNHPQFFEELSVLLDKFGHKDEAEKSRQYMNDILRQSGINFDIEDESNDGFDDDGPDDTPPDDGSWELGYKPD